MYILYTHITRHNKSLSLKSRILGQIEARHSTMTGYRAIFYTATLNRHSIPRTGYVEIRAFALVCREKFTRFIYVCITLNKEKDDNMYRWPSFKIYLFSFEKKFSLETGEKIRHPNYDENYDRSETPCVYCMYPRVFYALLSGEPFCEFDLSLSLSLPFSLFLGVEIYHVYACVRARAHVCVCVSFFRIPLYFS